MTRLLIALLLLGGLTIGIWLRIVTEPACAYGYCWSEGQKCLNSNQCGRDCVCAKENYSVWGTCYAK